MTAPATETVCEVRWADLDPNGHARHTAFMDWATHSRLVAFASAGLPATRFHGLGIGPVIFREEADYLREVQSGDRVRVSLEFTGASADWKHFRIRHRLTRQDGVACATVVVRGSWLSLAERRVVVPPPEIVRACEAMPRAADFGWLVPGSRPPAGGP
jgi:acyl-CoA thioester hydrolase